MVATYQIEPEELNSDFIKKIKATFKGKKISIIVQVKETSDETEEISNNKWLNEKIQRAEKDFHEGQNIVTFSPDDFSRQFGHL